MKKIIILLILISSLFAKGYRSVQYMTFRQMGMGNAFTAVADDFFLMGVNPANLALEKKYGLQHHKKDHPGILQLPLHATISFDHGAFSTLDLFRKEPEGDTEIKQAFYLMNEISRKHFAIETPTFPLTFGYVGHKWGFTFTGDIGVFLTAIGGLLPAMAGDADVSLELKAGMAPLTLSLAGTDNLRIGFTTKFMGQAFYKELIDAAWVVSFMDSNGKIRRQELINYFLETGQLGMGFGFDTGAMWDINEKWSAGLAVIDLLSPMWFRPLSDSDSERQFKLLVPDLSIGTAYRFTPSDRTVFANTMISLDLKRIFDPNYTIGTMIHMGVSTDLVYFKYFIWNFALGLNKGLLTFSTSMKLGVFRLSYAFWQDDEGVFANSFIRQKHLAEFSLRF